MYIKTYLCQRKNNGNRVFFGQSGRSLITVSRDFFIVVKNLGNIMGPFLDL